MDLITYALCKNNGGGGGGDIPFVEIPAKDLTSSQPLLSKTEDNKIAYHPDANINDIGINLPKTAAIFFDEEKEEQKEIEVSTTVGGGRLDYLCREEGQTIAWGEVGCTQFNYLGLWAQGKNSRSALKFGYDPISEEMKIELNHHVEITGIKNKKEWFLTNDWNPVNYSSLYPDEVCTNGKILFVPMEFQNDDEKQHNSTINSEKLCFEGYSSSGEYTCSEFKNNSLLFTDRYKVTYRGSTTLHSRNSIYNADGIKINKRISSVKLNEFTLDIINGIDCNNIDIRIDGESVKEAITKITELANKLGDIEKALDAINGFKDSEDNTY